MSLGSTFHVTGNPTWSNLDDPVQRRVFKSFVKQKTVWDMGADNLAMAAMMIADCDVAHVVAVDRDSGVRQFLPRFGPRASEIITVRQQWFCNLPFDTLEAQVAFIGWPSNFENEIYRVVDCPRVETVIYLGKNSDNLQCGTQNLFNSLRRRELLAYVPRLRNTLIVVGKHLPDGQDRPSAGAEEAPDWESYGDIPFAVESDILPGTRRIPVEL